jgi:hypothetical protein
MQQPPSQPPSDAREFDLLAASLRADARDLATFLEVVSAKLSDALPAFVRVERESSLLRRNPRVKRLMLRFGDRRYELERAAAGLEARVAHEVRGVTLKTEPVPLEHWIESISAALTQAAQETEQGSQALKRLLG